MMNDDLQQYMLDHSDDEPALLRELHRETYLKMLYPRMLSGHLQGRTLAMISKMIRPQHILEIGTFTGYSALCLAEGLQEGGSLDTLDNNPEHEWLSSSYFSKAGMTGIITPHLGDAQVLMPTLLTLKPYDLVFLDADKENYPVYYKILREHLKAGAYILADNVLWGGKVIQPVRSSDKETQGIVDFNRMVRDDCGAESVMLPLRDGLSIIRITGK